MPFTALNDEPDDQIEDDRDAIQELETEEAIRLYQATLSAKTQEDKAAAFEALFQNPILKDRRDEVEEPADDATTLDETQGSGASTLQQVLHRSWTNRGQFLLDSVQGQHFAQIDSDNDRRGKVIRALQDFSQALARDEDDVDAWRRAARAGRALGSLRTARFCLEAVVDGDEQGTDDIIGDAGVDIKLADHDLCDLKRELDDSYAHAPVIPKSAALPAIWKKQLALYPALPQIPTLHPDQEPAETMVEADRTWAAVGEALLQRLLTEQEAAQPAQPKCSLRLHLTKAQASIGGDRAMRSPELTRRRSTIPNRRDTFSAIDTDSLMSPPPEAPSSERTLTLPSRKRSTEAAELPETAEGGRVRSKRIKARESLAADPRELEPKTADAPDYEVRIKDCARGDEWLYEWLNLNLVRAGIRRKDSTKPYRALIREQHNQGLGEASKLPLGQAVLDFYNMMHKWDDNKSTAILRDAGNAAAADGHDTLQAFLEHSAAVKQKRPILSTDHLLDDFITKVNAGWTSVEQALQDWFCLVCRTYSSRSWTTGFRQTVVDALIAVEHSLFASFDQILRGAAPQGSSEKNTRAELAQTCFELHLERYASVVNANSVFDKASRLDQKARMDRWAFLSREAIHYRFLDEGPDQRSDGDNFLLLRHVWATVLHMQATVEVSQDYVVACFRHLKVELEEEPLTQSDLPNNTVMPELTIAAADREISKIETMGFFKDIFQKQSMPPVDLIESLEPLLERTVGSDEGKRHSPDGQSEATNAVESPRSDHEGRSTMEILSDFLKKASPSLRLLLWTRLRDAYLAIDYPPRVLSTQLRCIHVIMEGLKGEDFKAKSEEERGIYLLETIRDLRELIENAWNLVKEAKGKDLRSRLECFDIPHLQDSIRALLDLSLLLYAVCLFDDHSQIGGKSGPTINPFRSYPSDTFHTASIKLHNMQIQTFLLLYVLYCEVMAQAPEFFPTPFVNKAEYLKYVHYHFGMRRMCKGLESSFLHYVKDELMRDLPELMKTDSAHASTTELAQVLHDLYGIQCFTIAKEQADHGCDVDYLDHANAMQLVDFVLEKANVSSTKDVVKSDMSKAVEKIHSTLDWVVTRNDAAKRNGRIYKALLKSPILPVSLYRALRGLVDITAVPIKPSEAVVASKGWFFLKGQIALSKYRASRARGAPGNEDDLQEAIQFYMQDLEFSPERWETWFRMAQAYNWLVDEDVMWTAGTMDTDAEEVILNQRSAIHAYSFAVAMSTRSTDVSPETTGKLAELYYDFATCLYSATREPFSGQVFSFESFSDKHFWEEDDGEYEGRMFHALANHEAYRIAAVLLRRAAALKPKDWTTHYLLSKCYWKLHAQSDRRKSSLLTLQRSLTRAVETLPRRKDFTKQDLIMEPIYKVISITHKLVVRRHEMSPEDGALFIDKLLKLQQQLDVSKRPDFDRSSSWDAYVLDLLKMLRAADKSRWHHRPAILAAKIIQATESAKARQSAAGQPEYESSRELQLHIEREGAQAAKGYLLDQHIYSSKTMALNVWKPDNERPGRHHVYHTRYCHYLIELLDKTTDAEGIQMLVKRVRKKITEFFEHTKLWAFAAQTHVKIHERYAGIRRGAAEGVYNNIDLEQFKSMATKIDTWVNKKPDNEIQGRCCEALKELVDLKKLNNNLVKLPTLDDLITDTYGLIWMNAAPSAQVLDASAKNTEHEVECGEPQTNTASPARQEQPRSMLSFQHMLNVDGSSDRTSLPVRNVTPPRMPVPGVTTGDQPEPGQSLTPTKVRPKMIGRHQILKRAIETIAMKPVPKAASPSRQPSPAPGLSNIRVVIETAGQRGRSQDEGGAETVEARDSPPPGSVHDSADDESELSSVNEEAGDEDVPQPARPRFPAIFGQGPGAIASSLASDAEADVEENSAAANDAMVVDG